LPTPSVVSRRALSTRARLIMLVMAALVPAAIFAAVLLARYAATERVRHHEEAYELAHRLSAAVDRELVGLMAALEALATSPALQPGGDLAAFDAQARAVLRTRGTFVAMRDRTGQQIANTALPFGSPLPVTTDPAVLAVDREVFATGRATVSDLYTGAATGRRLVLVAGPVMRDGTVAYSLNIALEPARLAETLAATAPPNWTVSIVDRADRIVARSRQHERFLGREATADLKERARGEGGTWTGSTLEGTAVLGAYARSPLSGWRVAVGVPAAVVEAPLRELTWTLVATTALVLGLSIALAAWFARGIAGPMSALAGAAVRVGRGETVEPLDTGLREADAVGKALATASETLQERAAQRRAAEEALRDSEAKFQAIANSIDQMIWSTRPDGFHDYYNARWYDYTGVPAGSTDGEAWNGMFHPDDRERAWGVWRRCLATGEPYQIEYRLRHRSGQYRWVIGRAQCVRDAAGRITRWYGTCTDVHDLKAAEAALIDLNATLAERVAAATAERDMVWRTSRDLFVICGFDGHYRSVNPAWQDALGFPPEELVGARFETLIHPDDVEATRREFERLVTGGIVRDFDIRLRSKDGEWRWFSWTAIPENDAFAAAGRDITERRALEAQLRQSQKMEVVGQLTGGVAHDFNNLLTVVTGHLDMARRRLGSAGADERIQRNVASAIEGAQRAAILTHRLLAFSRQSPLQPEIVDLNTVVGGMSDLIRRTLGENIAIETALAGGLWRTEADLNGIENAILNLCVNARDAMPEGGKLTIESANVHLDEHDPAVARGDVKAGQYVMIAVRDTGGGMPPEVRDRVFEPFFTTKPVGKGTGLGLSQVYGFLRQSGGHAAIASEVGEGTTVKLYFPRLRGAAEMVQAAVVGAGTVEEGAGETILVVEDEQMVRDFTVAALEDAGYRVLAAGDGPSGIALLEAHPEVTLLFTDVVLAGPMNGRKVADEALARRPDLKVLFTTGYTRNAIVHHGRLDEGVELIAKPFTAVSLAERVARVLEGRG
jgi:PAS domain S-box-containing protein